MAAFLYFLPLFFFYDEWGEHGLNWYIFCAKKLHKRDALVQFWREFRKNCEFSATRMKSNRNFWVSQAKSKNFTIFLFLLRKNKKNLATLREIEISSKFQFLQNLFFASKK